MATKKAAVKKAAPKKVMPPPPKKVAAPKSNVVVVDFSEDSKQLLQGLITAITSAFAPVIVNAAAEPAPTKQVFQADIAKPLEKVAAATPPPPPNNVLTSIREMINVKAGEGKTAEIVPLLSKYGAQSASTLAAEHFEAFFEDLKAV